LTYIKAAFSSWLFRNLDTEPARKKAASSGGCGMG
jgi:hypothetical protein